jgi:hypothetical protein
MGNTGSREGGATPRTPAIRPASARRSPSVAGSATSGGSGGGSAQEDALPVTLATLLSLENLLAHKRSLAEDQAAMLRDLERQGGGSSRALDDTVEDDTPGEPF